MAQLGKGFAAQPEEPSLIPQGPTLLKEKKKGSSDHQVVTHCVGFRLVYHLTSNGRSCITCSISVEESKTRRKRTYWYKT